MQLPEVWKVDEKGSISMRCELNIPEPNVKGVWGSASFIGCNGNIIACAQDGEWKSFVLTSESHITDTTDIVHFWRDTTGEFAFEHFHSLNARGEQSNDIEDQIIRDEGRYKNGKRDKAIFAWTLKSGQALPIMASGYMGRLSTWSPRTDQEVDIQYTQTDDKPTTVRRYKNCGIYLLIPIQWQPFT